MFVEFIVSLFGIVFVHRNLSLLEKLEVLSPLKLKAAYCFLLLPYMLNLFFKELFVPVLINIGIFLITLILFDKIITYFAQKTFEKIHMQVIERLILLLKVGKSPQTSVKILFNDLTSWQKVTFAQLNHVFEIENVSNNHAITLNSSNLMFFNELKIILRATSHISEQLKAFYDALKLHHSLRHKSKLATQQTRAQALVCAFIYIGFLFLSTQYLQLEVFSVTVGVSLSLFLCGQLLIFRLGGSIKWKT
jgi:hypothetical protein